jgi:putative transposase
LLPYFNNDGSKKMTQTHTRKLIRRDRNEWQSLLSGFEHSALSVEAYCRRESISAASFYRWRGILCGKPQGRGEDTVRDAAPAFVDIGALHAGPVHRPRLDLKFDLGDGLVLHLVRG